MTTPTFLCTPTLASQQFKRTSQSQSTSASSATTSAYEPHSPHLTTTTSPLRSYLYPQHLARSPDLEGQGLKSRSPRTANIPHFDAGLTVPIPEHRAYPSAFSRQPKSFGAHRYPGRPQRKAATPPPPVVGNSPGTPRNVPSYPYPTSRGMSIPRPIIRLILVIIGTAAAAIILSRTSLLHVPFLRSVNVRRGAVILDRKAVGYVPPQMQTALMLERPHAPRAARTSLSFAPRPIPRTHEFLALQSYILQSDHNRLPTDTDPSAPLDGNAILAIAPTKLGRPGSAAEALWLRDLEREREEDIVVWSPGGFDKDAEGILDLLSRLHSDSKSPALIDLKLRSDRELLQIILGRLGMDGKAPMIMLGNKPLHGGLEMLKKMYEDKTLDEELKRIGWLDEWRATEARKPKNVEDFGKLAPKKKAGGGKPAAGQAKIKAKAKAKAKDKEKAAAAIVAAAEEKVAADKKREEGGKVEKEAAKEADEEDMVAEKPRIMNFKGH